GVANIMIISVLERRSEIGLRRALGATKSQIRTQFLGESVLLALIGGVVRERIDRAGRRRVRHSPALSVRLRYGARGGACSSAVRASDS
ncbi:MAG: putative transport system permease protein, partial [Actinomycetota bacterium]|nr:putative transport system permease protein [Actinomycetota bacterium]